MKHELLAFMNMEWSVFQQVLPALSVSNLIYWIYCHQVLKKSCSWFSEDAKLNNAVILLSLPSMSFSLMMNVSTWSTVAVTGGRWLNTPL